jgi:hypothetical protein
MRADLIKDPGLTDIQYQTISKKQGSINFSSGFKINTPKYHRFLFPEPGF